MPDRRQGAGLSDGPPRWLLIAGITVATAAVAVVLIVAAVHHAARSQPLVVASIPAPQAASPQCQALIAALPQRLGDYQRVALGAPVPPATAAWLSSSGDRRVVVRCGLDQPPDFVVGAPIQVVDAVQWFRDTGTGGGTGGGTGTGGIGGDQTTWSAVDRPVYIELTLPQGSGPTPIQQLSEVIAATMPAVPIRPGPAR